MESPSASRERAATALGRLGVALELAFFVWAWSWCSSLAARGSGIPQEGAAHGLDYLRWALFATPLWAALVALALFARGRRADTIGATRPRTGWMRALAVGLVWGAALVPVSWAALALAGLAGLSSDLSTFAISTCASWIGYLAGALLAGAFGEELVYRGYLFERVERLVEGLVPAAWTTRAALLASSLAFGASHYWQGTASIVGVSVLGLGLGLAFLRAGRNLAVPVVAHGVLDVVALTSLHLSA